LTRNNLIIISTKVEPHAGGYSVPAKVLTYITAGRLILASIPAENLAARTILSATAELTTDPKDPLELRRLARSLIVDADRRNQLGTAALIYARAGILPTASVMGVALAAQKRDNTPRQQRDSGSVS